MVGEGLFALGGNAVLAGWAMLVVAAMLPRRSLWAGRLAWVGGRAVPLALCGGYALLFLPVAARGGAAGDLFSLAGIVARFASPDRLFLLYFELLAFSLLIGGWMFEDARRRAFPRRLLVPLLALQCLFGPLGLLAHAVAAALRAPSEGKRRQGRFAVNQP